MTDISEDWQECGGLETLYTNLQGRESESRSVVFTSLRPHGQYRQSMEFSK